MAIKRKPGIKEKLFRATYDKQGVNKALINLRKSLDEVKGALNGSGNKK